jgi:hypothetical protein
MTTTNPQVDLFILRSDAEPEWVEGWLMPRPLAVGGAIESGVSWLEYVIIISVNLSNFIDLLTDLSSPTSRVRQEPSSLSVVQIAGSKSLS